MLLDSGMRGIEGLVAQLGRVDPRYQLALENCGGGTPRISGGRNDRVAAQGIDFLKRNRGGRSPTFLPLNRSVPPNLTPSRPGSGPGRIHSTTPLT